MKFLIDHNTFRYLIFTLFNLPLIVIGQIDFVGNYQNKIRTNLSLQSTYQNGHVFGTNDFLKGNNSLSDTINDFQAFSIKLSKQTTGQNQWEQIYNYPNYGIGFYVADFFNPKEIGTPFAFYGFFNAPFKRWENLTLNYEVGFGATFNWKAFNPINNKYNISIGAGQSFLIDVGLNLQYYLSEKIDIGAGFSLTHFSNGGLKQPNKGLNTIAPKVSLKYNFDNRPAFNRKEISKYNKEYEWLIRIFGGKKNVIFDSNNIDIIEKFEGVNFPVFGISTTINRQVSYKSKFGIGMSISYNGSVNAQVESDNNELEVKRGSFNDKIQLSIYPSYELVVNRFSLVFQPAIYVYRKKIKNQSPTFHQRIGLKYYFADNFFTGITLRDYDFSKSDFIEWNIGYRIKWK